MNVLAGLIGQCLHIALMATMAPTLAGIGIWLRARLAGRHGPTVLQPWMDLARLLRKSSVVAESASRVTSVAPAVCLAATATAACLVPSFARGMTLSPFADLVTIAGLLGLARCAMALQALDAGAPVGGTAARRAVHLGCGADMALLLAVFAFALAAGSTNIDVVAAAQRDADTGWRQGLLVAAAATSLVGLVDSGAWRRERSTEELAGADLALMQIAEALRLLVWFDVLGAVVLPFGMATADSDPIAWLVGLATWLGRTALFTLAVSVLHVAHGRLPLQRATGLLGIAILLGVIAIVMMFSNMRTA